MQIIPLANVPNQTFSTTLDGNRYVFAIYQCNGIMCYDLTMNEVAVATGQRITNGSFFVPFFAYQAGNGNFLLEVSGDDLPDWSLFGVSQTLIYLSNDEIVAAVASAPKVAVVTVPYQVAS